MDVKGLEGYYLDELSEILMNHISEKTYYLAGFQVVRLALIGSRVKGNNRKNSDLDVAVVYEGKYRSDSMADGLNGDQLMIDDIKVDFVPISIYKGQTFNESEPYLDLPI